VPSPYRVVGRRAETADVVTLALEPLAEPRPPFRHGQFHMLTAFGVGEVAISVSSPPTDGGPIEHTVRDVGPVTHALCSSESGTVLGVRGPFGTDWGLEDLHEGSDVGALRLGLEHPAEADVVVVAGGIGLAPLRGALCDLARRPGGRLFVAVGARSPDQVIYGPDLEAWARAGASVDVTVDVPSADWDGPVGLVTMLLTGATFDAGRTVALVCGPEVMMRFAAGTLIDRGVDPRRIRVSLERNMQCGVAQCGHCQLGPLLLCRDGPVVPYAAASQLLQERER